MRCAAKYVEKAAARVSAAALDDAQPLAADDASSAAAETLPAASVAAHAHGDSPRASAATGAAGRVAAVADEASSAARGWASSRAAALPRADAFSAAFAAHRMKLFTMRWKSRNEWIRPKQVIPVPDVV